MTDHEMTRRQTLWTMAALGLSGTTMLGADEPAAEERKPPGPPLTNPRSVLQGIPAEAAPKPNKGWDKYNFPKAVAWFDLNWGGRDVRMARKIEKVDVRSKLNSESPEDRWEISIRVNTDRFNFRGVEITVGFNLPFRFVGDDAFAKRCERIPKGRRTVMTGMIESAKLSSIQPSQKASAGFILKDYSLSGIA